METQVVHELLDMEHVNFLTNKTLCNPHPMRHAHTGTKGDTHKHSLNNSNRCLVLHKLLLESALMILKLRFAHVHLVRSRTWSGKGVHIHLLVVQQFMSILMSAKAIQEGCRRNASFGVCSANLIVESEDETMPWGANIDNNRRIGVQGLGTMTRSSKRRLVKLVESIANHGNTCATL